MKNEKPDLRIQKTYLSLHNAFTALLEEKRFEDFTVNELCDCAMIRRATFYKHFGDKYEYYAFYLKEVCTDFNARLVPGEESCDVNTYLLHMSRELLGFVKEHERLVQNAMESNTFPVLLGILLESIRSDTLRVLRQSRASAPLIDFRMEGMAAFFAGGVLSTLFRFLKSGQPINEEEFLRIVSMHLVDTASD